MVVAIMVIDFVADMSVQTDTRPEEQPAGFAIEQTGKIGSSVVNGEMLAVNLSGEARQSHRRCVRTSY
jgi:hypothetical protein